METTFKIANLKRKPVSGLVFEVTYVMNFKLENQMDRKVGLLTLEGDETDPNFVPFDQLTEEMVINWVKDSLGEEQIDAIKLEYQTILQQRIDKQKNPEFLTGRPWGN